MAKQDYTLGRPITDISSAYQEFQRVSVALRNKVTFRGIFDVSSGLRMTPPPRELDLWIEQNAGTVKMYLQISIKPRVRASWTVAVEDA